MLALQFQKKKRNPKLHIPREDYLTFWKRSKVIVLGSNVLDGSRVSFASKQKPFDTCSSTYTEDESLKCKQDIEFQSALQQDENLISFVDSFLTQSPNPPLPTLLTKEPVTQDEIRERRIQYFDNQSVTPVDVNDDNKIIRVNRMKVREDLIKHFLTGEKKWWLNAKKYSGKYQWTLAGYYTHQ